MTNNGTNGTGPQQIPSQEVIQETLNGCFGAIVARAAMEERGRVIRVIKALSDATETPLVGGLMAQLIACIESGFDPGDGKVSNIIAASVMPPPNLRIAP